MLDPLGTRSEHDSAIQIGIDLLDDLAEATTNDERNAIIANAVNDWIKTSRVDGKRRAPIHQHKLVTTIERDDRVSELAPTLRPLLDPLGSMKTRARSDCGDSAIEIAQDLTDELAEATTEEERHVIIDRMVNNGIKTSRVTGDRRKPFFQHELVETMLKDGRFNGLVAILKGKIDVTNSRWYREISPSRNDVGAILEELVESINNTLSFQIAPPNKLAGEYDVAIPSEFVVYFFCIFSDVVVHQQETSHILLLCYPKFIQSWDL